MTAKKDRLLKAIACLLDSHSADDWKYVAERLEEAARISRTLAAKSVSTKSKSARRKSSRIQNEKSVREMALSFETQAFSDYLKSRRPKLNAGRLREVAIAIGMKAELPKNISGAQGEIFRHLDDLNEKSRLERIASAIELLERESADQSEEYGRWVSLITKRIHAD